MKKSIIYLGIALVSLSNVSNASNNLTNEKIFFYKEKSFSLGNENLKEKKAPKIVDETIFNPETVVPMNYAKPIEQIITENKRIIEDNATVNNELVYLEKSIQEIIIADNQIIESNINNQVEPIYIEKSIEDIINADNQLIESDISNEVYPLDFEIMNRKIDTLKQINKQKFIGMK